MFEKKHMTPEELKDLMDRVSVGITKEERESFGRTYSEEIAREYQILLLSNPNFPELYPELMLRRTAFLLVYAKRKKDDDGWKRPRKPKPEPPLPQGNGARKVLEPA